MTSFLEVDSVSALLYNIYIIKVQRIKDEKDKFPYSYDMV